MTHEHRYHPDAARRTPVPPDSYYDPPDEPESEDLCFECFDAPADGDYFGEPMCHECAAEAYEADEADRQIQAAKEGEL